METLWARQTLEPSCQGRVTSGAETLLDVLPLEKEKGTKFHVRENSRLPRPSLREILRLTAKHYPY